MLIDERVERPDSWYEPDPETPDVCAMCGWEVDYLDSVGIRGGEERFCDKDCLQRWVSENVEEAAERLEA